MKKNFGKHARNSNLVILHIGMEKTGTTSVQRFLESNFDKLARQNVTLLRNIGGPNNRDFVAFFQKDARDWERRKGIKNAQQKAKFFQDLIASFDSELRLSMKPSKKLISRNVILSSEQFSSLLTTEDELENLKQFLLNYFDEIRIICYFRAQADMSVSRHSTALWGQDWASLQQRLTAVVPENSYYNFHKIAKKWAAVFGKESLNFRIYGRRSLLNNDIRHDFLDVLKSIGMEIDPSKFTYQEPDNESLSSLQGAVFSAINRIVPYWNKPPLEGVNKDNLRIKRLVLDIPEMAVGKFMAENTADVQQRFYESNRRFFDEFLPGQSFELEPSSESDDSMPLKEVEHVVYELSKTLLSEKVNSNGPALLDSDAEYLRDIAISILEKKPLYEIDAAKLLELALRVRPDGPAIKKQLARARRGLTQS